MRRPIWGDGRSDGGVEGLPASRLGGAVHDETVLLTHEDLWHGVKTLELPNVSGKLPELRELLAQRDFDAADRLLADELEFRGYHPDIGTPLPLAAASIGQVARVRNIVDRNGHKAQGGVGVGKLLCNICG